MAKKTVSKKAPEKPLCSVELQVDDLVLKAEGKTLAEALDKLIKDEQFPQGSKTRAALHYKVGDKEGSQFWMPVKARRMFTQLSRREWVAEVLAERMENSVA